jgi:outer membrane protein assembly factor BamE (lipoprotein component of BamABCDE complex)
MYDMKTNTVLSLALFSILCSGCASVGRNFDSTSLGWLKPGETDKAALLSKIGQPFRVGMDAGDQTWTYGYYKYRVFGGSVTKDLVIRFDLGEKVKSYTLNTSFPDEKARLDPALKK